MVEDSSQKLDELLESEPITDEIFEDSIIDNSSEKLNELLEKESDTIEFDLEKDSEIEIVTDDYSINIDDENLSKNDIEKSILEQLKKIKEKNFREFIVKNIINIKKLENKQLIKYIFELNKSFTPNESDEYYDVYTAFRDRLIEVWGKN